jgi:hypothetical protein
MVVRRDGPGLLVPATIGSRQSFGDELGWLDAGEFLIEAAVGVGEAVRMPDQSEDERPCGGFPGAGASAARAMPERPASRSGMVFMVSMGLGADVR